MADLFRREAVRHATRRLEGEVILATPFSVKTLGLFLVAVILAVTVFLSNATYARVHKLLGDTGTVELVGMLGYYVMVSMILDTFRMPAPEGTPAPFREPASK